MNNSHVFTSHREERGEETRSVVFSGENISIMDDLKMCIY